MKGNFFMAQMDSEFDEALNTGIPALTNAPQAILEISDEDNERYQVAFSALLDLPVDPLEQAWHERILPVVDEYSDRVRDRANLVLSQGAGHIVEAMHGRLHAFTHSNHPDCHPAGYNALEIF
jgi:hypothetical protein